MRAKTYSKRYLDYITSPAWFALRERKLNQVLRRCARCGSPNHLHVHHLTYKRLGRELLEDLEVLCKPCHQKEHPGKWRQPRLRKPRYLSPEDREQKLAARRLGRAARLAKAGVVADGPL